MVAQEASSVGQPPGFSHSHRVGFPLPIWSGKSFTRNIAQTNGGAQRKSNFALWAVTQHAPPEPTYKRAQNRQTEVIITSQYGHLCGLQGLRPSLGSMHVNESGPCQHQPVTFIRPDKISRKKKKKLLRHKPAQESPILTWEA